MRRDLSRSLRHKQIKTCQVSWPGIVAGSAPGLKKFLLGQKVKGLRRRGKLLIVDFVDSDKSMLVHLKMTGQLFCQTKNYTVAGGHGEEVPENLATNKHTHFVASFKTGEQLFFNDLRKFGYLKLVNPKQLDKVLARYGPEPLSPDFTVEYLQERLKNRQTSLKSFLLNQQVIAGLGNIYVDEVCFAAKVRPTRKAQRVTKAEAKKLHAAIQKIITQAIVARGTTFSDYRDGAGQPGGYFKKLKVYGRANQPCRRAGCKGVVKKIKHGGRGTHFCSSCQV